ncbi:ylmG homolog protein 1-2, chloroplastic-like [Lotus japonicus]|uniref:Uncharacterized protein n=1 Tax=Lotus japonicus TaxID=34305 RepID=I3ST74_LOTJA|nr:ylmG homolog protein 1-2, chloroplastic-like [Lotus japonicus]AFK43466.1 unknown [Lotus japonicus]
MAATMTMASARLIAFHTPSAAKNQSPPCLIGRRHPHPPQCHLPRLLHNHRQTRTVSCSLTTNQRNSPVCEIRESAHTTLSGSTRTVTTLLSMALLCAKAIPPLANGAISMSVGGSSLFFASLRDRPEGYLNTPLTVVAAGLGKWLDIYSGVLMVRVLLSWFPNIPWERQPLSAIRDLCDPYLNLFRNIIPPVFDTLDVSPLLAFAVLGTLGSILQTAMT